MNIIFDKRNYDVETINLQLKTYCDKEDISNASLLKMQLISEEFLANILFPNFDGEVKMLIKNNTLIFEYTGVDYMNAISESTIISHKILEKQAQEINSTTLDNVTTVSFVI